MAGFNPQREGYKPRGSSLLQCAKGSFNPQREGYKQATKRRQKSDKNHVSIPKGKATNVVANFWVDVGKK